jgi:hypothetical protein
MNKNRTEGAAKPGEWVMNREAVVIKARWRRNSDRLLKTVLTIAYFDKQGVPRRS